MASARDELDRFAAAPDGQNRTARSARDRFCLGRVCTVTIDDGRLVGRQQVFEQAHLGGEVVFNGRMVVQVVAAEIGEGSGLDADAVEAMLVEAVR